jgi:hypothetical protein
LSGLPVSALKGNRASHIDVGYVMTAQGLCQLSDLGEAPSTPRVNQNE